MRTWPYTVALGGCALLIGVGFIIRERRKTEGGGGGGGGGMFGGGGFSPFGMFGG